MDFRLKQTATASGSGKLDVGALRQLIAGPSGSKIPETATIKIDQVSDQREGDDWKVTLEWEG